jgi:hypothetical protein
MSSQEINDASLRMRILQWRPASYYDPPMQTSSTVSIETIGPDTHRFVLRYAQEGRTGFQRITSTLDADMLTSLALFCESIDIAHAAGSPVSCDVELGNLHLGYDASHHQLKISRFLGNALQQADLDPRDLAISLEPAIEAALTLARSGEDTTFICNTIAACPVPAALSACTEDSSSIDRRVRALTILFLASEIKTKSNALRRLIRSKTKKDEARRDIAAVFNALAENLCPPGAQADQAA